MPRTASRPRSTTKPSLAALATMAAPIAEREPIPLTDLATPAELANEHPGIFTEPGLRWLIRQRRSNGLDKAGAVLIVRNRQVLVRSRFERWLASQVA